MNESVDVASTELVAPEDKQDEKTPAPPSSVVHLLPPIQPLPVSTVATTATVTTTTTVTASPAKTIKKEIDISSTDMSIATNLDLMTLTKSIPRDYAGLTDVSVKEEARKAYEKARSDKETLTTVNAYMKYIAETVTLKQLAEAPLKYAVYPENSTSQLVPTLGLGISTNMCLGNASGTGYVYVPYLSAVQWILLGAVRRKFGINTAIGVKSIGTYNIFSSYCYIDVVIHNTSVKYTMIDGASPLVVTDIRDKIVEHPQ